MSKINAGNITLTLGDDELTLVPTLRATQAISRQFGGLGKARDELMAQNFDAAVIVLRIGANVSDRDARDLPDRVWANGLTADLLVALINYLAVLGNGGKPLVEEQEEVGFAEPAQAAAGN